MASNRRQAVTWTKADVFHRRQYAALGGDGLIAGEYIWLAYVFFELKKWDPFEGVLSFLSVLINFVSQDILNLIWT